MRMQRYKYFWLVNHKQPIKYTLKRDNNEVRWSGPHVFNIPKHIQARKMELLLHFSDKNHLFCSLETKQIKQYNNEQLQKVFRSNRGNPGRHPAFLQRLHHTAQLQRCPGRITGNHVCRTPAPHLHGQEDLTSVPLQHKRGETFGFTSLVLYPNTLPRAWCWYALGFQLHIPAQSPTAVQ